MQRSFFRERWTFCVQVWRAKPLIEKELIYGKIVTLYNLYWFKVTVTGSQDNVSLYSRVEQNSFAQSVEDPSDPLGRK